MKRPILLLMINLIMLGVLFGSVNLLMANDVKTERKIIVFEKGVNLQEETQKVEKLYGLFLKSLI